MEEKNAYQRKKDPVSVRRLLLKAATDIAAKGGVSAISLSLVAQKAGVTKGGLLHHFESRQALISAMLAEHIQVLDEMIDAAISQDDHSYGSFTRAYIEVGLNLNSKERKRWSAVFGSVVDKECVDAFSSWFSSRLKKHLSTDSDPQLEIARLACDGAWFYLSSSSHSIDVERLKENLLGMTYGVEDKRKKSRKANL